MAAGTQGLAVRPQSTLDIVQEALSNAMRHAPGSHVRVHVAYRPDALALEVRNDAVQAVPVMAGSGGWRPTNSSTNVRGSHTPMPAFTMPPIIEDRPLDRTTMNWTRPTASHGSRT